MPTKYLQKILSAPAQRALDNKGIKTLKQLSKFSEAEILSWHGIGPMTIPNLKMALKGLGLSLRVEGLRE